ncbi:MAG: hypothetical protein K0R15_1967 [Clostridiales bacterium]|jgi:hypothetical protein|nr:hypothetical protein [Clostridiales bacterium]
MNLFVIGVQNENKHRFICYLGKYLSGKYKVGIVSLYKKDCYDIDVFEIEEREDLIINSTISNTYDYDVIIYDICKDRESLEDGNKIFYSTIDKADMDKNKPNFTTSSLSDQSFIVYDNLIKGSCIDKRFICNYLLGEGNVPKKIFFIHYNLDTQRVLMENDFKQCYSLKRLRGEYLSTIVNLCTLMELTGGDETKKILKVCEGR